MSASFSYKALLASVLWPKNIRLSLVPVFVSACVYRLLFELIELHVVVSMSGALILVPQVYLVHYVSVLCFRS
jgi:hypothetical protein